MATVEHAQSANDDPRTDVADNGQHASRRRTWLPTPRTGGGFSAGAGLVAAVTVGALSLAVLVTGKPSAPAQGSAEAVARTRSVAELLGVDAAETEASDAVRRRALLEQLAASRARREADQVAAAETQAEEEEAALARAEAEAAEAAEAARAAADQTARGEAVMPINGARLTSPFGPRWGALHGGVDLAAPMMTPEYAAMDGIVLQAGSASGFGQAVYIQHENGDVTVYGHMEQILVSAGQVVRAGDTIALVGNRGQSTGPHLHFEVRLGGLDGEQVDPLVYLRERGVEV